MIPHDVLPAVELLPTGQLEQTWDGSTYGIYTEKLPPFGSEANEAAVPAVVTEYVPAAHGIHEELVALVVV